MVLQIIKYRWERTSWRKIAFGYLNLKTGIILWCFQSAFKICDSFYCCGILQTQEVNEEFETGSIKRWSEVTPLKWFI